MVTIKGLNCPIQLDQNFSQTQRGCCLPLQSGQHCISEVILLVLLGRFQMQGTGDTTGLEQAWENTHSI